MKKTILVSTAISALFLGGIFSLASAQPGDVTDGESAQTQGKPTSLLPDGEKKDGETSGTSSTMGTDDTMTMDAAADATTETKKDL